MARRRTRWNRRVLAWSIVAATFVSQLGFVGVSAQVVDPTPLVRCPQLQPIVKFTSSVVPTQAGWVQHWIRQLRRQVPAVVVPPVLMGVQRNEMVAVCLAVVSGPATVGLGTNADVAILAVSKTAAEEFARFDSQVFSVQLPTTSATIDDNTRFFDYPGGGARSWRYVERPGRTWRR